MATKRKNKQHVLLVDSAVATAFHNAATRSGYSKVALFNKLIDRFFAMSVRERREVISAYAKVVQEEKGRKATNMSVGVSPKNARRLRRYFARHGHKKKVVIGAIMSLVSRWSL